MIKLTLRAAATALALGGAMPLLAQIPAPPAPQAAPAGAYGMPGEGMRGMRGAGMFAKLSDAGRITMRDAMRAGGDRRADPDAVMAARDQMLVILDAENLDSGALKRAMDDERRVAQAGHEKRQAAMLAGFGMLSVTDRNVFVASAREMLTRMEERVGKMRSGDMQPPI